MDIKTEASTLLERWAHGACPWGTDQQHMQVTLNYMIDIYTIPPAQAQFNISSYCAVGEKEKKKSGLWRLLGTDWRKGDKIRETELGWGGGSYL